MRDLLFRPEGVRRGPGAGALAHPWVLVLDGRVAHCAPHPPEGLPEGIPRLEGGWLMEPLADAHVHLCLLGTFDGTARRRAAALPREEAVAGILGRLERYRLRGLAAVREAGAPRGLALEAAAIARRSPERYALALPAGEPLFPRGGYGGFLGTGVADLLDALRKMEDLRRAGATHAKILATGLNSLDEAGIVGPAQFSPEDLRALLATARRLELPVMIHANGSLAGLDGVLGPDATLEHGFGLSEADLETLAEAGAAWTPTLGAWAELTGNQELTPHQREVVERTDAHHREEVRRGHALGVTILAGSDAGTPGVNHENGLLGELGHLRRCGLSAQAVLASALHTKDLCERELGCALGGLAVGGPVGFIWLARDPALDLSTLGKPLGVWLGGRWNSSTEGRTP